MSLRFLIATVFILITFLGGFLTADQEWGFWPEIVLIIGGFIGAVLSLLLLNKPKFNKKLW